MFFHVDPSNGLAIYDQIVRQVKFAVANSGLRPRDLVPSVRELSHTLALNPNTIARAYRELQNDGVLTAVRGTGLEVTDGAPKQCRQQRKALIRERLSGALGEAFVSGLSIDEIRGLVDQELAKLERRPPAIAGQNGEHQSIVD